MKMSSNNNKFLRSDSLTSESSDTQENASGKKEFTVSKSRIIGLINWVHVAKLYLPFALAAVVLVLIYQISHKLHLYGFDFNVY